MAEALVSAVVEELGSFTSRQLQHEWSLISGIKGNVENLKSNLEAIQAVLVDAEKRQIKDASVKHWLWRLKEVSFQIDAVLDEWNTAINRSNNTKTQHPLRKLCIFVQSFGFHSHDQVTPVSLRHRIAREIEGLNHKLEEIYSEKEKFTFITKENTTEPQRPKTTSFDVAEPLGREAEKKTLITKLLSKSSETARRRHDIIPLVGAGGIGKTTLAQLVFNDEIVKAHFDSKIWVCVSDPFDEKTIARAIAESLKIKDFDKIVEFQNLLERIHESIEGKKFLLVLDDVWAEEDRKWKQLENSLRNGAVGSKILVTTRKEKVAIMMGAKNSMISIEHLSEKVCWSIFSQIAFSENEKSDELEEIGQQIAQRCKGLPLVAKTLGSLMRFKKYTKEEWERVLHSELWQLQEIENEVFVPLLLSYYDLPPLEKRCFLFTSYFPKDHVIDRDHVIQLWLSEGYLNIKKDYKRKGIDCFESLAMRSLIQDFEKDENGDIRKFKMHDIVHDFVLFLSKNEWLNLPLKSEESRSLEEKAFHCTLVLELGAEIPTSIYNKKFLRTLSVRGLGNESDVISWDMLLKLTCLRTLDLHDCNFAKLPKGIEELVHLRYLSLSQGRSDVAIELPESMCNLFNLQTLILKCFVRELPKGIHKLVNLRHLYLESWFHLPKGLGELTCLETLNQFRVATKDSGIFKKRHMKLEDLNKLNHLKGRLFIDGIGGVKDVGEADRAQLKSKGGLVDLNLSFSGGDSSELGSRNSTLLLEGLQPHPNLKHLFISNYHGTTLFPGWMTSLINLKSLTLVLYPNCESLGPFGKLPSLESLDIQFVEKVKKVGVEFLGIGADSDPTKMDNCSSSTSFPKLKDLQFFNLHNWEEWESCTSSGNEDRISLTTIMPSLVSLVIIDCQKLKAPLPDFLRRTTLQNLTISGCPNLQQLCQQGMGTEELVKILTSPTSQPATDTTKGTEETIGETCSSDDHQMLRSYDHEISPAEDDDENLHEHRALHR